MGAAQLTDEMTTEWALLNSLAAAENRNARERLRAPRNADVRRLARAGWRVGASRMAALTPQLATP